MRLAGPRYVVAASVAVAMAVSTVSQGSDQRFPPPDFRSGYQLPQDQYVLPHGLWRDWLDVSLLAIALALAAWFAIRKRSRVGVFAVTLFSLAYFGFYRQGCVCAVGSIQNVSAAALGTELGLPWVVGLFFALPLIAALFVGRVFCAAVCPLGAVQDLVLLKPLQVPGWLEAGLGLFAHLYLAAAVVYAAVGSEYIICALDPFVGFFRFSASIGMLLLGGALLLASMFVGRTYCRFLCPYGVVLRSLSVFAKWPVHVSPSACVACQLCQTACPFGAIDRPQSGMPGKSRVRHTVLGIVLGLIAIAAGAWAGYAGRDLWARLDSTVQLARIVETSQQGALSGDALDRFTAWEKTGETAEQLHARAADVTSRLGMGATIAGAWLGGVIAFRLLKWGRRAPRTLYDANAGTCVACARCFNSCPVELDRRGEVRPSSSLVPLTIAQERVA